MAGYGNDYGNDYGNGYGLADPTTLLVPSDRFAPWPDKTISLPAPVPIPLGIYSLYEAAPGLFGAFSDAQPITSLMESLTGYRLASFYDDFYERFYITPAALDFGIVVDETTLAFDVWNAHLAVGAMMSIDEGDLAYSQVDINSGPLPRVYKPLEVVTLTATADITGPTSISGVAPVVFSPTQVIQVSVEGTRGRLWPFTPNWSDSLRQTWEYKTEIIRSRSGKEQRSALRTTPRKSLEFTAVVTGQDRRSLSILMDKYQHVEQVVPDIPRHVTATSAVLGSASTITVDSVPDWLLVSNLVVVVSGKKSYLRYIESVDSVDKEITFSNIVGEDLPAGVMVCYAFVGNLDNTIQSRRLTNDVAQLSFRFNAAPTREPYIDPGTAPTLFLGKEVLTERPNWGSPVEVNFERESETVDYGRGPVARFNPIAFGTHAMRWAFLNADYARADYLQKVFQRAKGQRGEFYMPTWENDLPLKMTVPLGGVNFRVNGQSVSDAYFNSTVWKKVMVLLTDGTILYRAVTGMFEVNDVNGNDTVIQVHTGWPREIKPEDVVMISWMPCCRFASDQLTIEWLTNTKSQIQINTRTLEDEDAEI